MIVFQIFDDTLNVEPTFGVKCSHETYAKFTISAIDMQASVNVQRFIEIEAHKALLEQCEFCKRADGSTLPATRFPEGAEL